jgi:hypothetical protein
MDTCEEWDDLNRAILAAEEAPPTDASPRYEFKGDTLMRYSTLASGEAEDHGCDVDDIEQVAYAIEDAKGKWFVVDEVATGSHRSRLDHGVRRGRVPEALRARARRRHRQPPPRGWTDSRPSRRSRSSRSARSRPARHE